MPKPKRAETPAPDEVEFIANFPPIMSAIKVGDDGMRITLDVSEAELANAIRIMAWRHLNLTVKITPVQDGRD